MVQAAGPREIAAEWAVFERAREGEAVAWRELTSRHQPRLTALVLFVTRSPAATDDVVQETFVRAMQARIKNHSGSVSGYLGTIAYRLAVKEAQRSRRNSDIEALDPPGLGPDQLEEMLSAERDRQVAAAIARLSREHREVLALRFYAGHSYEEIAALVGVPLGTVKSRIFHAVQACRKILSAEGVLE